MLLFLNPEVFIQQEEGKSNISQSSNLIQETKRDLPYRDTFPIKTNSDFYSAFKSSSTVNTSLADESLL